MSRVPETNAPFQYAVENEEDNVRIRVRVVKGEVFYIETDLVVVGLHFH